jgi:hypothetical protein
MKLVGKTFKKNSQIVVKQQLKEGAGGGLPSSGFGKRLNINQTKSTKFFLKIF